jgi:hypothetical protein
MATAQETLIGQSGAAAVADSQPICARDRSPDPPQAAPLECSVPVGRVPIPGEMLSVYDTLADPPPGAGRYYVASVRHGSQIRAGRSRMSGVMQGGTPRCCRGVSDGSQGSVAVLL